MPILKARGQQQGHITEYAVLSSLLFQFNHWSRLSVDGEINYNRQIITFL